MSLKNSNENIGNQTRDLPTFSAAPSTPWIVYVASNNGYTL